MWFPWPLAAHVPPQKTKIQRERIQVVCLLFGKHSQELVLSEKAGVGARTAIGGGGGLEHFTRAGVLLRFFFLAPFFFSSSSSSSPNHSVIIVVRSSISVRNSHVSNARAILPICCVVKWEGVRSPESPAISRSSSAFGPRLLWWEGCTNEPLATMREVREGKKLLDHCPEGEVLAKEELAQHEANHVDVELGANFGHRLGSQGNEEKRAGA